MNEVDEIPWEIVYRRATLPWSEQYSTEYISTIVHDTNLRIDDGDIIIFDEFGSRDDTLPWNNTNDRDWS